MRGNKGRYGWLLIAGMILLVIGQASAARLDDKDRILVWLAPVAFPGTQSASQPGELDFIDKNGELLPVMAVPEQSTRVEVCGQNAVSPDGSHVALFMGSDTGQHGGGLYLMKGTEAPLLVDTIQFLGCMGGNGRLMWSPDGSHFAYIAYEADARTSTFAAGQLNIVRTDDAEIEATIDEDVTSFDFTDDGVVYTVFYTDSFGRADNLTVNVWDGEGNNELFELEAAEGCEFLSSYIKAAPSGYWMVVGKRCAESEWQLYRVEPDGSNALLAISQNPRGAFTTFSETINLIFSPDQEQLLYSLPDGVTTNTVGWERVSVDDLPASQTVIEREAVMSSFAVGKNAVPQFSPDGSYLAMVVAPSTEESSVQVLDLSDLSRPPHVATIERRGEFVSFMAFTSDSRHVVYIAGAERGEGNAIYRLDVESGESERIVRGTFSPWAQLSPDGETLVVLQWVVPDTGPRDPKHLNLVAVDLGNGESTVLLEGAVDQNGETSNRVAVPLYWVRN